MSSTINSNGTIPQATSGYNPIAITSSTNASPIEVTTGTHGYVEGDTVAIEGHRVNTNANGFWVVHIVSSTKFTLVGSTGNGVGGATGYAIDYAINPVLTVPADTDMASASSVNAPLGGLFNLSPYLYERVGQYRLYNIGRVAHSDALDQGAVGTASVPNTSTWTTLATFNYQWSFSRDVNIYNTDILVLQVEAFVVVGSGSTVNGIGLGANFNSAGMTLITGSAAGIYAASAQANMTLDATLYANDFTATQLNSMTIGIMGWNAGVSSQTFTVENPYHVNVFHYRVNS